MQLRFDGLIGFPGGLVDPGEDPLFALNRELHEEIGLDLTKFSFEEENHILTCYHEKKNLVLHFYAKEVNFEDFQEIERKNLTAIEYGTEVNEPSNHMDNVSMQYNAHFLKLYEWHFSVENL